MLTDETHNNRVTKVLAKFLLLNKGSSSFSFRCEGVVLGCNEFIEKQIAESIEI
jgi:hypothetical protein